MAQPGLDRPRPPASHAAGLAPPLPPLEVLPGRMRKMAGAKSFAEKVSQLNVALLLLLLLLI